MQHFHRLDVIAITVDIAIVVVVVVVVVVVASASVSIITLKTPKSSRSLALHAGAHMGFSSPLAKLPGLFLRSLMWVTVMEKPYYVL